MLCIKNLNTNPYFNIASEEFLLKNIDSECFMLYCNQPSVIVGKHQNTYAEINSAFVRENQIPVVRRLSGGGTVYHDLGNVNFAFIHTGENGKLINFRKFIEPIVDTLKNWNIEAEIGKRNDIKIAGKKVSGNAEHIYKNRVLHHGTLLFSSNLNHLNESLNNNYAKYLDKSVKLVKSEVVNISDFMAENISISEFYNSIFESICKNFANSKDYQFTESDLITINNSVENKYSKWSWNYGYSRKYQFTNSFSTENGTVSIHFNVENGEIQTAKIYSDFVFDWCEIEKILCNQSHDYDIIKQNLLNVSKYFDTFELDKFLKSLF